METRSRCGNGASEHRARDLPMRDGNNLGALEYATGESARDLPMRDGNGEKVTVVYQGWARPRSSYEGWKLRSSRTARRSAASARDLPMRDGNYDIRVERHGAPLARDLPMRDGNRRQERAFRRLRGRPRSSYEGWKL